MDTTNEIVIHEDNNDQEINFNNLYGKLQEIYGEIEINKDNFFLLVVKAVELTDNIKSLSGIQKKELVLKVLKKTITNLDLDDNLESELLNESLDNIIDTIIEKSLNKKIVNKLIKKKNKKVDKLSVGAIIEKLITKLTNLFCEKKIEVNDLIFKMITVISKLMDLVEEFPYLSKVEKKEVITQSLKKFINNKLPDLVDIGDNEKNALAMANLLVPQLVDGLFAIENSEILNNIKRNRLVKKVCFCCY